MPNGLRISGAEGVRCMRGFGDHIISLILLLR
jgi:hypothetical protein